MMVKRAVVAKVTVALLVFTSLDSFTPIGLQARLKRKSVNYFNCPVPKNQSRLVLDGIPFSLESPEKRHNVCFSNPWPGTFRFEIRPGDIRAGEVGARERAEYRFAGDDPNGHMRTASLELRVEDNPIDSRYFIIVQWNSKAASLHKRPPWLAIAYDKTEGWRLRWLAIDESGKQLFTRYVKLQVGKTWRRVKIETATGRQNGRLIVWLDEKQIVDYAGPLGQFQDWTSDLEHVPSSMGYFKFGIYRWGGTTKKTVNRQDVPTKNKAVVLFRNVKFN